MDCGHKDTGQARCGRCNKCFHGCCRCREVEPATKLLPKKPSSGIKAAEKYARWWVGKRCRNALSDEPFKLVVDVKLIGPPSFVYGSVWLVFEDGTEKPVISYGSFVPRKSDVEIEPDLAAPTQS